MTRWKVVMRRGDRTWETTGFNSYTHAALFKHYVKAAYDTVEIEEDLENTP